MVCSGTVRLMHSSTALKTAVASINKSLLAQLRKSTGYSISHCKKALELHNNDLQQANSWLAAQAQAEGWAKASKLAGRSTSQGLLGLSVSKDNTQATMLELNCETDFVARNSLFVDLTTELTESCLNTTPTTCLSGTDSVPINKELWNAEQVSSLRHSDGKTFGDKVALSIGLCGENMILSRALKMSTAGTGGQLFGYCHPNPSDVGVAGSANCSTLLGRFAALVAVRNLAPEKPLDLTVLKQLCLQVIGMDPQSIGTEDEIRNYAEELSKKAAAETPKASSQQQAEAATAGTEAATAGTVAAGESSEAAASEANEQDSSTMDKTPLDRFLLKQDWLEDDDITVEQVLQDSGIEVLDFVRMTVGQSSSQ